MIDNTFIFLDKVGFTTERKLWAQGIHTWDDFLKAQTVQGMSCARKTIYNLKIQKAKANLSVANHPFFKQEFPRNQHWRLWNKFKEDAVYIDIETTGYHGDMTILGMYHDNETHIMVRGQSLEKENFHKILDRAKMVVTFNGASFDLPIIEKYFKTKIELPHIDLRHVCAKIGLTGGLKLIEKTVGISRADEVAGFTGADAVTLWYQYRNTGDPRYLEKLVKYNEEDIVNLKPLAEHAIPLLWNRLRSDFC